MRGRLIVTCIKQNGFPDQFCVLFQGLFSYIMSGPVNMSVVKVPAEEIMGHYQCGFLHNRSTTDHVFCIRQILEKKMGTQ